MTLDDELVEQVDQLAKAINTTRSAFTREALTRAIHYYKQLDLEHKQQQGYLKHPAGKDEFDAWEKEQVWGDE
jgi:predicted transcriptional regulator